MVLLYPAATFAQPGQQSFTFLDVPSFARITGMGGYLVSQPDTDVNLVLTNPAQSGDSLNRQLGISYLDYVGDIRKLQMAYQHQLGKAGNWFVAVDHIAYGDLEGYDDTGMYTGDFRSAEDMIMVGTSHAVGVFRLGGSLKFLSSDIAGFGANALAVDIGGTFRHPDRDLSVGMVIRNLGFMLSDFDKGSSTTLPFDVQAGVSFKPEFMPFRFHVTLFGLADWDSVEGLEDKSTAEQIFGHVNFGTEVLLHRNIQLRFGYNHGRRNELRLDNAGGGAGFSYGIVFRTERFSLAYSRGGYHVAGGANNFTVMINTGEVFRKRIKL